MKKHAMFILFFGFVIGILSGGCARVTTHESLEASVPTIHVSGKGTVTAQPDEATARFGVRSEERSLARAYERNTREMNAIISSVKSLGVEDKDMHTSSYSITPVYATDERGRKLPGKPVSFRVDQELTVRIRDISRTGVLIDTVVSQGSNVFNGISFGLSMQNDIERKAKVKALGDAQKKAVLIAESLGVSLGRVLRVDESAVRPYGTMAVRTFDTREAAPAPHIEVGSLEVIASCNLVYEIVQ